MIAALDVKARELTGTRKVLKLRAEGLFPAVLYKEGKPGTNLSVEERAFNKVLHSGTRVVTLKWDGKQAQALIKAVQYDALGEMIMHVDFNELREGQKVRLKIPLTIKGSPKGSADGGVLNQPLHELEVECLPTAIPERISVDVDPLEIGQALHVSELKLPAGVTALNKGTDVVAACVEPREEEAAATPAEGAPTEPEVLMEKKEEAPEGAAPAAGDKKGGDKGGDKKDAKK